jgi:hypothetical protein
VKVKDLIEALSAMDLNLEVLCFCEDPGVVSSTELFKLFDLDEVSIVEGETSRSDDRKPLFSIGPSKASRKFAAISITTDF